MISPTLLELVRAAEAAAEVIRRHYEGNFAVEFKGPNDPVTRADQEANDLLCERLGRIFPGVPIVAEESDPASYAQFYDRPEILFVDPLDGTRDFVRRNGEFVVMIGLVSARVAELGLVLQPTTGRVWIGDRSHGAWRGNGTEGNWSPLRIPRGPKTLHGARILRSRSRPCPLPDVVEGNTLAWEYVSVGSAGLKGAMVAEGQAHAYLAAPDGGKRWDAAAVDALVVGAGGAYTDLWGKTFDYHTPSLQNSRGAVATSTEFHQLLLNKRLIPPSEA